MAHRAAAQVLRVGLHVDDHHPLGSAEVLEQRRDDGVRGAQAPLVRVQRRAHAQQAHAAGAAERGGLEDVVDGLQQACSALAPPHGTRSVCPVAIR